MDSQLRQSAILYWSVNDMDLSLKKQIMKLVNSPEWEYNQALIILIETRMKLDAAISSLILLESQTPEATVVFYQSIQDAKRYIDNTLEKSCIS